MSETKDGGPAFPRAPFDVNDYCGDGSPGMSLRDWFAGQALAGMMANCDSTAMNGWLGVQDQAASYAYTVADAMLAAREASQ